MSASVNGIRSKYSNIIHDIIRLSRPHHWELITLPVIFSILYASDSINQILSPISIWFVLYFFIPMNLYVFGLNDVFDTDTDELNDRKSEGSIERVFNWDTTIVVAIVGSGLLIGTGALFTSSTIVRQLLALSAILVPLYSAPPLRLKQIPIIDSLANGSFILPAVAAYTAIDGSLPPLPAIIGMWLWFSGCHALAATVDIEPDREAGVSTIATYLGQKWTLAYCGCVWLVTALLLSQIHPIGGVLFIIYPAIIIYTLFSDVEPYAILSKLQIINCAVFVPIIVGGIYSVI